MSDAVPKPRVAILAGGLGTRLGELTRDTPKPMIVAGGRPFLAWVIDSFRERNFNEFVLLTGHHGDRIERFFGDGRSLGINITYSRESEPLGTGGAIREARHLFRDRFLLTYGDVLRRFDYDRFVQAHPGPCLAVYPSVASGNTAIEGDRVVRFDKRATDLPYVDAGFCTMPASVIDLLPPRGACSFEQTVFPQLAGSLSCEVVDHNFFDIGTPDELARARAALAK